jgi:hypothetical protein
MMVGYVHDCSTHWRICNAEFKRTGTQPDIMFDEERNAYISYPHSLKRLQRIHPETTEIDIIDLPQEEVHSCDWWDNEIHHGLLVRSRNRSRL